MASPSPKNSLGPSLLTSECNIDAHQSHMQTDVDLNTGCTEGFVGCIGPHSPHEPVSAEVHSCREMHTVTCADE